MNLNRLLWTAVLLPLGYIPVSALAQNNADRVSLQFPIKCTLDQTCFLQQFVDMDDSEAHIDPFCGGATYDGHKGTDIRLRSIEDMDDDIEVLSAASGVIKGVRRNTPDRLVRSEADRKAVAGKECGNGVVIDHGNGIETQYCHMKQGSAAVRVGDQVKAGDILGLVGISGMAQFPHLHLAVRKDGQIIDPFTGNSPSQGCEADSNESWWADTSVLTAKHDTILLGSGLSGAPIEHSTMVVKRPPKTTTKDAATVGWVWYSNLKKNDRIYINLDGPGGLAAETTTDPLNRNKASWSGFVGKRRQPQLGEYKITSYILRESETGLAKKLSQNETVVIVDK